MIIYKHIPKTAGLSIKELLPENVLFLGHDYYNPFYKHLYYHLHKGYKNYVFSIVRNPYDRVVSAFFYLNNGGNNPLDEFDKIKYIKKYNGCFKKFISNAFPEILQQIHFMPQHTWIYFNNICLCDDIYRFEDIIRYPSFPHKNKSNHKKYREYYDNKTAEIIQYYYRKDFELFEYSTEL